MSRTAQWSAVTKSACDEWPKQRRAYEVCSVRRAAAVIGAKPQDILLSQV